MDYVILFTLQSWLSSRAKVQCHITAACEGSLCQWVQYVIISDVTFFSYFCDTTLCTSGVWISCATNPYFAMDKHEGVIRNKLEGFSCEPCHARFYRLHDGGGFIDGAAESWKHHILGTIYCYSLSLIRVILSLKRSRYLSLLTIHQYQWCMNWL